MNFKEMCRTCLRSGEMMSSIFDEEIESAMHTAADLLAMFTSVQVDKADDFPHKICDTCLKEIQQAYLFDLKCRKSEIILHQLREIRVTLKKLNEIPKQKKIFSEGTGELESIIKEDFKLEDIMNLCDRIISDSESNTSERIGSVEEENANASEKLNFQIVEEECTRDLQLAFKSEPDHSNHFMKDDTNEKELERIKMVSNFQIEREDCDPEIQITLKQEPDHNCPIIRNNECQNELELNQNSSNFVILNEGAQEYQVSFNTGHDQNNLIIKDNESEGELEFSEISSNFQIVEEDGFPHFRVNFKTEPELDIGIDCNDEELKCSTCLKLFQSLDMFRGHIVSDHLEENICRLCNEEFECSQFEHSAKHLPFSEPEKPSGSSEKSITQTEKVHMRAIHKDELFGKPDFQCKICSKVFVRRYRLVDHMRIHTGEKPFDCELCPEMFRNRSSLLCHRRTKHTDELISDNKPERDLQCSVCYKVFDHKYLLRDHMCKHTGEKPFDCELCPEKFRKRDALLCHRRTKHTDEFISDDKPVSEYQCSVCSKVFGMKCRLRVHMRIHTGEKPYDCELCPEKFGNRDALLCHRRTKHADEFISDDKPVPDFQCNICYKVFGRKYLLRDHMCTHTGEKPFDCELCPEKFRKRHALLCHRRTKHTDEFISDDKPVPDFQCSVCSKVFAMKCRLRVHMRTHSGEKPFDCKLCPEKFRKRGSLLCHIRTKHTDEFISDDTPVPDFQCSICSKVFGMKYLLRDHMRMHTGEKPIQCKLCPEKFRKNIDLLSHRRTKHTDEFISDDKPVPDFQCSICYKVFGLKCLLRKHMRTHTGEKPFGCELCPKTFIDSRALLYHRRTKHTDQFISDDKPVPDFQCSVCSKVFGMKCRLRVHMRTHTGEKPFDCELCPEKFGNRDALLCHRRTKHTYELISDDKPIPDYQCSICYKVFGRKYLLRDHMCTHTGEKPFDCELCPEKFASSYGLLRHRRTNHTDEFISDNKPIPDFQCSICYKVFGLKCRLRVHMRTHTGEKPFDCELCPEKFRKRGSLQCHRRTKHTNELISDTAPVPDFQCSVCSKVFGMKYLLRNHMRTHTGEKPIDRELCPEK